MRDCKHAPLAVVPWNNLSELDSAFEAMQLALQVQSMFLGILHSTTVGHLHHSLLELHHAETTTFPSQLEACLQTAAVEQFQKIMVLLAS
jgi:hypothetical protein